MLQPKIITQKELKVINVLGDRQHFRLTGEDTKGAFTLFEQINSPGTGIPMHVHTKEDEVFHVLEGEMEFLLEDRSIRATPGTTVYLPAGLPHGFRVLQKTRALVSLFPAGIEKMFLKLSELKEPDPEKIQAICKAYGLTFL